MEFEDQTTEEQSQEHTVDALPKTGAMIRITDHDLQPFLENLDHEWSGNFSIADQSITDETILRFAALLKSGICRFIGLDFSGNKQITFIGGMALSDSLKNNTLVRKLLLHNITLEREGTKYS
jgi:hypothetical protein